MKLHPRHANTTSARLAIEKAVQDACETYSLSWAELLSILALILNGWAGAHLKADRDEFGSSRPRDHE